MSSAPLGNHGVVLNGLIGTQDGRANSTPDSPSGRHRSTRLPPLGRSSRTAQGRAASGLPSVVTVASSLAIVLGVFFLVAWGMRRAAPAGAMALPSEVFEVLGHAPMASRQQAHLLRCGRKLVLVSVTTAGAETITEITDPVEVDRLAGLCRQAHPQSTTAAFRQVLKQFAQRRHPSGFLGDDDHLNAHLTDAGAPANHDESEARDV